MRARENMRRAPKTPRSRSPLRLVHDPHQLPNDPGDRRLRPDPRLLDHPSRSVRDALKSLSEDLLFGRASGRACAVLVTDDDLVVPERNGASNLRRSPENPQVVLRFRSTTWSTT